MRQHLQIAEGFNGGRVLANSVSRSLKRIERAQPESCPRYSALQVC